MTSRIGYGSEARRWTYEDGYLKSNFEGFLVDQWLFVTKNKKHAIQWIFDYNSKYS